MTLFRSSVDTTGPAVARKPINGARAGEREARRPGRSATKPNTYLQKEGTQVPRLAQIGNRQ